MEWIFDFKGLADLMEGEQVFMENDIPWYEDFLVLNVIWFVVFDSWWIAYEYKCSGMRMEFVSTDTYVVYVGAIKSVVTCLPWEELG